MVVPVHTANERRGIGRDTDRLQYVYARLFRASEGFADAGAAAWILCISFAAADFSGNRPHADGCDSICLSYPAL